MTNCCLPELTTKQKLLINIPDMEDLKPCVPLYGTLKIDGLEAGKTMLLCRCGLSKNGPWCDNSHKGTKFKPTKWKVPDNVGPKRVLRFCHCKYSKNFPQCDGSHADLPTALLTNQYHCDNQDNHTDSLKICEKCGWTPDQVLSYKDLL
ncbi:hypothetical protein CONCODRAFT_78468 [Conidiobolus coronatus NRRL 28638]|uniref:Iron-binding zinc finger CDGSH type domain-containing protein n=1 Tax=Conidiobolus coronatus (strain ATCC 28846 / CBS 209.66 / NRRL 28638) TaxID=796925 RepID=A0A137P895_CONC2|nr:hypothetical protein CONCODRAFT_78468 [Conidiobolus coronatus NRRL 28638]|eukprot:KXN71225.1 hypothetical protein CONCODRAFT_78468 [Conidiobolus coronatus NRRL 28638]